jgi:uncharacterized protein (DUF1800 family)
MPNVEWNRDAVAHLLRRAGFGATQQELDAYLSMGLERAVDTLVDFESVPNASLDTLLAQFPFNFERARDTQVWWLLRMLYTARPLEEKMAFFWHNYFATSVAKVSGPAMKTQVDLFHSMALGGFRDMLVAVSRDPAMLDWLDNRLNRVGRPNENYARELLELFSMGEGNGYTETDIQEIARCFTGWTIRNEEFFFAAGTHDNGAKVVLGQAIAAGGGQADGERVCDIVAARPETARYLATRLFEAFAHPAPSAATVDRLAAVYTANGYSVRAVMRSLLTSDEFWSARARFALVKSPVEFALGAFKALNAQVDVRRLSADIAPMGQVLLAPPDVGGWDGGLAWINTTTLLNRANFANSLTVDRSLETPPRGHAFDATALLGGQTFDKSKKLVDHVLEVMGPIVLSKKEKKPLKTYVEVDDAGVKQPFKLDDATIDKKVRGLVHLVMTLPEYHLA